MVDKTKCCCVIYFLHNPESFAEYWTTMFLYLSYCHRGGSSNDKGFSILSLPVHLSVVSVSFLSIYPFVKLSSSVSHSEGSEFYPLANLLQTFVLTQWNIHHYRRECEGYQLPFLWFRMCINLLKSTGYMMHQQV